MTETRHIIGLVSYYGNFIANLSNIMRPSNDLTKKNIPFSLSSLCQVSFDTIKITLTNSPDLIFPHSTQKYIHFTEASKYSWSVVLMLARVAKISGKDILFTPHYLHLWHFHWFKKELGLLDKRSLCNLHSIKNLYYYYYYYYYYYCHYYHYALCIAP